LSSNPISQAEVGRIREELVGCEVTTDDLLPAPDLKLAHSSDLPQNEHGLDKDDDLPCGSRPKPTKSPACIPSWNQMVKRGFDQAQLQVCYDKQKKLGAGRRWPPDWKEENWVQFGQNCGIGKQLLATPLMWCCCRPSDNALVSIQNN
jgi:hypothetical protein